MIPVEGLLQHMQEWGSKYFQGSGFYTGSHECPASTAVITHGQVLFFELKYND